MTIIDISFFEIIMIGLVVTMPLHAWLGVKILRNYINWPDRLQLISRKHLFVAFYLADMSAYFYSYIAVTLASTIVDMPYPMIIPVVVLTGFGVLKMMTKLNAEEAIELFLSYLGYSFVFYGVPVILYYVASASVFLFYYEY